MDIKIRRTSRKSTTDWSDREWHKEDVRHYGHRVEWNNRSFRFKATDESGKMLGLIVGDVESGILYISQIITVKEARGKGIGTMLLKRAEDFGRKFNAHRTWLVTGRDWTENMFYKKLGFKLIGIIPDFHFHKDFVIYTREIK